MKTGKLKKILSIVIISVILAITAAVIILAVVPKTLYNPLEEGYAFLTIWRDGQQNSYVINDNSTDEAKEISSNILKYQEESVKDSLLSTIFQGTGKFNARVVAGSEGNVETSIAKASGQICLVFNYIEEQTLKIDGEEYKNPNANDPDAPVKYTKLFMPISNTTDFQECTVYLTGADNVSNYQIKFLAHQSEIRSYLVSLRWSTYSEE